MLAETPASRLVSSGMLRDFMTSPTQRSLAKLRNDGWTFVEVTERWVPFAKVRRDLFQFIDVLAIRKDETLAVQTTSGSHVAARFAKMQALPSVVNWLECKTRKIVIHGWSKRGALGKRKQWTCREVQVVLGPTGSPILKENE